MDSIWSMALRASTATPNHRASWLPSRIPPPLPTSLRCPPGGQFLHLLLGEVEPDAVVQGGDGADRDGNFLAAPQMALADQDVGHPVIGRVHGKAFQPPDPA